MRAVDTNVLVRLVARGDAKQVAAAESFVASGAWVSHLALVDAGWVLESVYKRNPAQIATAIDMLLNHQSLTIQDAEVVSEALEQFRKKPVLGFSDCLMLAVARRAGHTPLGTFDKELSKLPDTQRL